MGKKPIRYFDYSLMILLLFLLAFGLIMLYSTSSYYGATRYDDSAYYVKRQMVAALLGLAAMLVISRIPYQPNDQRADLQRISQIKNLTE